jgi:hypothetical protein
VLLGLSELSVNGSLFEAFRAVHAILSCRAKKDMGEATDPFLRAVYNGRQLALKISANSVYGEPKRTEVLLPAGFPRANWFACLQASLVPRWEPCHALKFPHQSQHLDGK